MPVTVKSLAKNRERYLVATLRAQQERHYEPFDEDKFQQIVRRCHQRQALNRGDSKKPHQIFSHRSMLKKMAFHEESKAKAGEEIGRLLRQMVDAIKGEFY